MADSKNPIVSMSTSKGDIRIELDAQKAPVTTQNFVDYVNNGHYDGLIFHRVIPGFMIQGGDPYSKTGAGPVGTGGPGYQIKAEFNDVHHTRGTLSMARSQDPDSAGSQFFICHQESPNTSNLDGQYTAFGQVVEGIDVVDKIVNLPTDMNDRPTPNEAILKSVRIEKWPLKK